MLLFLSPGICFSCRRRQIYSSLWSIFSYILTLLKDVHLSFKIGTNLQEPFSWLKEPDLISDTGWSSVRTGHPHSNYMSQWILFLYADLLAEKKNIFDFYPILEFHIFFIFGYTWNLVNLYFVGIPLLYSS